MKLRERFPLLIVLITSNSFLWRRRERSIPRRMGVGGNTGQGTGRMRLPEMCQSHTLPAWGGGHGALQGLMGLPVPTEWTTRSFRGQALQYQGKERHPGSCEKMQLDYLTNSVWYQGTEICYSGVSRNCTSRLDREGCLARGPDLWKPVQRGLLGRPEDLICGSVCRGDFQVGQRSQA